MAAPGRSFSFNYQDDTSLSRDDQQPHHSRPYHAYQNPQARPLLDQDMEDAPPPPPAHRVHPGMHPGSRFDELQSQRNYGGQSPPVNNINTAIPRRPVSQSPTSPTRGYADQNYNPSADRRGSFTTPGVDNLSQRAAGGGIAGIAMGVAGTHERESGVQALRDIETWGRSGQNGVGGGASITPTERQISPMEYGPQHGAYDPYIPENRPYIQSSQPSSTSFEPLANAAYAPGSVTPRSQFADQNRSHEGMPPPFSPDRSYQQYGDDAYSNRYSASNTRLDPVLASFDPSQIEDDGDDGFTHGHGQKRRSFLGIGGKAPSDKNGRGVAAGAAGAGAATGAALANVGHNNGHGYYGPVPGSNGAGSGSLGSEPHGEKSEWLNKQASGNRKLKLIVAVGVILLIIGGIVGGTVGGIVSRKDSSDSSSSSSTSAQNSQSVANDNKSDLDKDSKEIKALLNNKDLHKVFPGMDYTPMNAQYPDCIHVPPSQNNITRDMAVLSQLTNAVRLYGTDCNQTQMVIHSIKQLGLSDMKVWLGVYLDNNKTTNARQLSQMWDILDEYGADPFKGVIVGNEVLFRKDLTSAELGEILSEVKTNMTKKGIDLKLGSSDLGDNWTANLAQSVDIVMANIHPFFAGVTADKAAAWTWNFWQDHDVVTTQGMSGKTHVISEVGWPSDGGNDCGEATCTSTTQGSIAGIDEMNTFMDSWVCQSLKNGTEYFWFEAIDEPWKIRFNTKNENWEDKWGLLDVNRNLKDGVKIPDCGGQTV